MRRCLAVSVPIDSGLLTPVICQPLVAYVEHAFLRHLHIACSSYMPCVSNDSDKIYKAAQQITTSFSQVRLMAKTKDTQI